jgi:histidinol phosphatase-like enzyme (inositol monophosphatase family)
VGFVDPQQLREILEFAVAAAREAGALTLQYFHGDPAVWLKADRSPVTTADLEAETLLRRRIEQRFPGHGILGEEHGESAGREPGRWIVDPIDGTFSFICGVPLYSTLVGFEWRGQMLAGVIHLPALGVTVWAGQGLGCRFGDRPARVSDVAELAQARLSTTSIRTAQRCGRYERYARLRDACRTDRGWPDAYAYAVLAAGGVDVVVDPIMSPWDSAALVPIVTEAGGRFTDWAGNPGHMAPEALATNGHLHAQAVRLLSM